MKNLQLNAVLMSRILGGSLLLGIILIGVGFYFAEQQLASIATSVNHTKIDSELAEDELQRLKQLDTYLIENADEIDRAAKIVAESELYQYQNQVIDDLNSYAARHGIRIQSVDFPTDDKAASASPAPNGLKKTAVTVTVAGGIPYSQFMEFVRSIEHNLTKIQVSKLSLGIDDDPNLLANSSIGLEVYLR